MLATDVPVEWVTGIVTFLGGGIAALWMALGKSRSELKETQAAFRADIKSLNNERVSDMKVIFDKYEAQLSSHIDSEKALLKAQTKENSKLDALEKGQERIERLLS